MTDQNLRSTDAAENLGITVEPTEGRGRLPAVIEHPSLQRKRPRLHLAILALLIIVAGPGIGWFGWAVENSIGLCHTCGEDSVEGGGE